MSKKYTVTFTQICSVTVTVEATDEEAAIEAAYDVAPTQLSAKDSGWGEEWSRDLNDVLEPEVVYDETNTEVWSARERWTRVPEGGAPDA